MRDQHDEQKLFHFHTTPLLLLETDRPVFDMDLVQVVITSRSGHASAVDLRQYLIQLEIIGLQQRLILSIPLPQLILHYNQE